MNQKQTAFQKAVTRLPELPAFCCAILMLCVIPLYFDNAFFNINRCKVHLIRMIVPGLCAFMAFFLIGKHVIFKESNFSKPFASDIAMGFFLFTCTISCAMQGFNESVLEGTSGRNLGLWLMLSLGCAYYVIALGRLDGRLLTGLMLICATLCAGLGILNGAGLDPLGFYQGIKKGQEVMFFSTIGNFDFFGTYLVMMFGVASGFLLFANRTVERVLAAVCAVGFALGMIVSRTDSALVGMFLIDLTLFVLAGGQFMRMACASALSAICFALLPAGRFLLSISPYHPVMDGIAQMLLETHAAHILSAVLLLTALLFIVLDRRGIRAPSRRLLGRIAITVLIAALVLFLALAIWFTVYDTETDLGSLTTLLRFDDMWGSVRGFVYKRSFRAFSDYSPAEKLFGKGLGQTLAILTPYCDNQAAIDSAGGVFTDAHCQPLQFLLTCGLVGAAAFLAFYASMLLMLLKQMKRGSLLCGIFAALIGYSVVMMLNVAQPILLSTYFPLCALALSRIRRLTKGASHES